MESSGGEELKGGLPMKTCLDGSFLLTRWNVIRDVNPAVAEIVFKAIARDGADKVSFIFDEGKLKQVNVKY